MSANWLPVLASPKISDKHMGRKGQMTFSATIFDKLVSSTQVTLQHWTKIIPDSEQFRSVTEAAFPGFWLRAERVGTDFASRIIMSVGKAMETGAAVKVPATEIFIYHASNLGFARKKNHSYVSEGERAKQFLARRGHGTSASKILKQATEYLGLSNHCSIGIYAEAGGTHIVIVPSPADIDICRVYAAGHSGSFRMADREPVTTSNHVSAYMQTVPDELFKTSASKETILSLIDERCTHSGYRATLKEAIVEGLASDFRSNYRKEAASPRIFATGMSLQFMPSWLRAALFPQWFEMDFSNMHLSILNGEAELGLDLSKSIWDQIIESWEPRIRAAGDACGRKSMLSEAGIDGLFHGHMNSGPDKNFFFDASKVDRIRLKKALKTSLYSLQFGMASSAARRAFTGDLLEIGFTRAEATFLGNLWSADPLLQKIAAGISTYCASRNIGPSELANKCQSVETRLVREIYDVALSFRRSDLSITLHSHDGVSVWARKPQIAEKFYRKCARQTGRLLSKLGIQSRLELKGLVLPTRIKKHAADMCRCLSRADYTSVSFCMPPPPKATGPPTD